MKLLETKIEDFNLSQITKDSIDKKGLGKTLLINTILDEKYKTLELLFEVKSSVNDPHHVDMKGKERKGLKFGYSVIIKFFGLTPEHIKGLKKADEEALVDVIIDCDAKVHCDDPSFYWQAGQERNHKKKNARYDFQGTPGKGIWAQRHALAGGKDGERLCKHLYAAREWLIDNTASVVRVIKKDFFARHPEAKNLPKEEPKKEVINEKPVEEIKTETGNRQGINKSQEPKEEIKTEQDAVKTPKKEEPEEEETKEEEKPNGEKETEEVNESVLFRALLKVIG